MSAFDKVIGYKNAKHELLQLCDMLRNREIYEEMGARLPHGLLLYGDPGLGKTLLARCFVEESGLHTITVRRDKGGDAFIDGITQAFASAKTKAPSIVLLDDMDKFANEDDTHCDAPEYAAVQAGIDDVKDTGVFVIATANDIRKLPSSLRRSGRFDRKIGLQAPTASDAEEIITHYLKTKRVSDSVNMEDLTRIMRYNSCAELETILNEAAVRAAFARKTGIDMEDMVSVVLKQQYGAQEDMPRVSDEVIEKVALHEAGHLVVCEALCPGSVGFASLLPSDENRCGGFIHCCKGVSDSQSAIIALGGKAAVEMRYAGQIAEGCSDDIARAVNCTFVCALLRKLFHFLFHYYGKRVPFCQTRRRFFHISLSLLTTTVFLKCRKRVQKSSKSLSSLTASCAAMMGGDYLTVIDRDRKGCASEV